MILGNTSSFIDLNSRKLSDPCEDLPIAISLLLEAITFSSSLHFAEGVSQVSDWTAVGRLELDGVEHWSGECTNFSKGSWQQWVINVHGQVRNTQRTCLAQERQGNSETFYAWCKQCPSFSTSAAKTTLSWPETAISSLFFNLLNTETAGTLFLQVDSTTFCRNGKYMYASVHFAIPCSAKPTHSRMLSKADTSAWKKKHQFWQL